MMAVYILAIIAFLFVNYQLIGRKVKLIAGEIDDIISNIQNKKGDLTVRVQTETSSELVLIKNGS